MENENTYIKEDTVHPEASDGLLDALWAAHAHKNDCRLFEL